MNPAVRAMTEARELAERREAAEARDLYAQGWDAGVSWAASLAREIATTKPDYTPGQVAAFIMERANRR